MIDRPRGYTNVQLPLFYFASVEYEIQYMLNDIDLTLRLSKSEYKKDFEHLDVLLSRQQRALREAGIPV